MISDVKDTQQTSILKRVLIVLGMTLLLTGSQSAQAQSTLGLRPAATFWPLPAQAGQTHWWTFTWVNGGYYNNAHPTECVIPDPVNAPPKVGIGASYFADGAFGGQSLLSINFFKDRTCTYWWPKAEKIMRWYSTGMVTSNTTINDTAEPGNSSNRFLAFRGHSAWIPERSKNITFWNASGQLRKQVNGIYAWPTVNGVDAFDTGLKYSYARMATPNTLEDNAQIPNYAVLPDRMLTANIILSTDTVVNEPANTFNTFPRHCKYGAGNTAWAQLQQNTCPALSVAAWGLFIRATTATYNGKPVLYVGYSEPWGTGGAGVPGACEEWWYAQDIGPIVIRAWDATSLADCRTLLQGSRPGANVNDYTSMPWWDNNKLIGRLTLSDYCVTAGCKVGYHGEDYIGAE